MPGVVPYTPAPSSGVSPYTPSVGVSPYQGTTPAVWAYQTENGMAEMIQSIMPLFVMMMLMMMLVPMMKSMAGAMK